MVLYVKTLSLGFQACALCCRAGGRWEGGGVPGGRHQPTPSPGARHWEHTMRRGSRAAARRVRRSRGRWPHGWRKDGVTATEHGAEHPAGGWKGANNDRFWAFSQWIISEREVRNRPRPSLETQLLSPATPSRSGRSTSVCLKGLPCLNISLDFN